MLSVNGVDVQDWRQVGAEPERFSKKYIGKFSGRLLIVASGRCVWDDIQKVWPFGGDVMCVNDIIMHFPAPIKHAYSNDFEMLPAWIAARRPRYRIDWGNPIPHTCSEKAVGTNGFWAMPGCGTSSLNACYVGIALGYDEIVLAGAPLDNSGHYFDPPAPLFNNQKLSNFEKEVPSRDGQPRYWQLSNKVFKGRVKALSGRTAEWLGLPDNVAHNG